MHSSRLRFAGWFDSRVRQNERAQPTSNYRRRSDAGSLPSIVSTSLLATEGSAHQWQATWSKAGAGKRTALFCLPSNDGRRVRSLYFAATLLSKLPLHADEAANPQPLRGSA